MGMVPYHTLLTTDTLNVSEAGLQNERNVVQTGFETCFGWGRWDPTTTRCRDPIHPRQVPYHEPAAVIAAVGS